MYVDENLNKMISFFNTAREAKSQIVDPPDTMTVDTSATDTSVTDTTVTDTLDNDSMQTRLPSNWKQLAHVGLIGNKLVAFGNGGEYHCAIGSMNGSETWRGDFRGSLDLSWLSSGTYAIVVTFPSGISKSLKFAKK